jgi:starch-binding outer membrane protein, SusD/RagB family
MKNIFFPIIAVTVLFASCKKELDQAPISQVATGEFYKTQNDFIQGLNSVYSSLRPYPDRQLNLSETRSDNLYAVSDGGVREWEGINSFHKTIASNPYVVEAYNTNFNGIFKANEFLRQLQEKGSEIVTTEALRTRMEAEARFLRAFYYFDLVRWFGEVPVVKTPLLASEALTVPRSPVNEVYDFILDDLHFAEEQLPETYPAADKGRPTKWAAKGILALVHMTRSGPTYGIKGPGLGLNEWQTAFDLLQQIITSNRFSFLPKYMDIFSYNNENNAEVVFDIQYINGANPVLGSTFPWVLVPDTWFQSKGKPVQGGLTIRPVSNDLLDAYETGDKRRDSIIVSGYTYNGATESRPFFVKYVDLTKVPTNSRLDWPINFIVLRYTDVLMLKAECILQGATGGTQADVDAIVNQVRARAGLTTQVSGVTLPQLMEERRKEFAAEGSRWHDLVRSGLVETVIPAWIAKEDVQKTMKPFEKNFIIYPIPQAELDVKKGLYEQNAGY